MGERRCIGGGGRVANGSERRRWQRHIPLNQNQPPPYIFLVREGRGKKGAGVAVGTLGST